MKLIALSIAELIIGVLLRISIFYTIFLVNQQMGYLCTGLYALTWLMGLIVDDHFKKAEVEQIRKYINQHNSNDE